MSKSSSATKLPSQVQKIGNNAEALAVETGMKPGDKPVETASAQLNVVTEPVIKKATKIDPDDYKERYSRYKTTTDETIRELRGTLASVQETLAIVQGQYQELLAKPAQSNSQPVDAVKPESSAVTKDSPAYKEYLDRLPESVKTEYAEDYLFDQFLIHNSLEGIASAAPSNMSELEAKIDGVVQFQEKTKHELYLDAMDLAFPDDEWINLTSTKEWAGFCNRSVSEVDQRTFGEIVNQGNDSYNAQTVIWVIKQYKDHLLTLESGNNSKADPLMNQLTPDGSGSGGSDPITEINAQAETFTQSQVNQFFKDAATSKKYTKEEAASIEQSIIAAQSAGKIIPG